jgi:hypothetical protein
MQACGMLCCILPDVLSVTLTMPEGCVQPSGSTDVCRTLDPVINPTGNPNLWFTCDGGTLYCIVVCGSGGLEAFFESTTAGPGEPDTWCAFALELTTGTVACGPGLFLAGTATITSAGPRLAGVESVVTGPARCGGDCPPYYGGMTAAAGPTASAEPFDVWAVEGPG